MWHCLKTVTQTQGVRTLYKGLAPNVVGVFPEKALKLSINEAMRRALSDAAGLYNYEAYRPMSSRCYT